MKVLIAYCPAGTTCGPNLSYNEGTGTSSNTNGQATTTQAAGTPSLANTPLPPSTPSSSSNPVPQSAACASYLGPGFIPCPGGNGYDCYNPATEIYCGDGSTFLLLVINL
jgi:hypothetical protein